MSAAVSTYLQTPLTLPRNIVEMTVRGVVIDQLRTRSVEFDEYVKEAWEQGYRPERCIHGTRMVFSDDRDAICGQCEESLTLGEEADAITHEFVSRFVEARDQFQSVLDVAVAVHEPVALWYPFVSMLANRAVDLLAPVWPVEPTRWHALSGAGK